MKECINMLVKEKNVKEKMKEVDSSNLKAGKIEKQNSTRRISNNDIFYISNLSDFDSDHDQGVSQVSSSKFVKYGPTLTSKASFSKVVRSDASLISKASLKNQHQKEPITPIIINSD